MSPSDTPALRALVATRYDDASGHLADERVERMAWIAFENPTTDGHPHYFVAERDGQIVGYLGRMLVLMTDPAGGVIRACYLHDLYVGPDSRRGGAGLFLAMGLCRAAEDVSPGPFLGLWMNEITLEINKRRGYDIEEFPQFIKVFHAGRYFERALGAAWWVRLAAGVAGLALRVMDMPLLMPRSSRADVEKVERFDRRFDELAESLSTATGRRTVPGSAVLNWKFVDAPNDGFKSYAVSQEGALVGYYVLGPSSEGIARIVDLQCRLQDRDLVSAVVGSAVRMLRDDGMHAIVCFATDPRLVSVLKRFRFLDARRAIPVATKGFNQGHEAGWHLGFGESDFVMLE